MGYLGKSATFVWHVSVSSVKRSRHRFAASRWQPVLTPGTQVETRDTNWGAILADIPKIPGLLSAIFRLIEAHRNEIRARPASFAANRSGCSPRSHSPCVYPAVLDRVMWSSLRTSQARATRRARWEARGSVPL